MSRDAIIGCATSYQWAELWPLVCSTRKHAPSCRLLLLVGDGTSRATIEILEEHGVCVVPCTLTSTPYLAPYIGEEGILRPFGLERLGPMRLVVARFAAIYAYLRVHGFEYDRVLLTDTRDVISIGDIWAHAWPDNRVSLFREWSGQTIRTCPYNSAAIRACYGERMLELLGRRPILCSGSILGPTGLVMGLLEAMLRDFGTINCSQPGILDQAVLNVVAARWAVPVREWDNDDGAGAGDCSPLLNIGYMPGDTPDLAGRAMIHQYDRFPHRDLAAKLLAEI